MAFLTVKFTCSRCRAVTILTKNSEGQWSITEQGYSCSMFGHTLDDALLCESDHLMEDVDGPVGCVHDKKWAVTNQDGEIVEVCDNHLLDACMLHETHNSGVDVIEITKRKL